MKTKVKKAISRFLPLAIVVLLALVVILGQHIVLSGKAEKARADALAEAGAVSRMIPVADDITIDQATIKEVLASANELVTTSYYFTDADIYMKSKHLFKTNISLPFTTDKTVFTYTGVLSAGLDLTKADIDVKEDKKLILLQLPQPEILHKEIDGENFQYYDVKNSVFTSTTIGEYAEMISDLLAVQEEKLKNNENFWEYVKESSKNNLEKLIKTADVKDQYTVLVEWKS